MTPKGDALQESTAIIREIETSLDENLRRKREEIGRELEERLRREREETDKKLSMIEQEFEKEKGSLREFHGAVTEFESAREGLEAKLREHLDRSAGFQKEIERMTALTREELHAAAELSVRLADLRFSTEERISEFRSHLKERFALDPKPVQEAYSHPNPASIPTAVPIHPPAAEKAAPPHPEPPPAPPKDVEPAAVAPLAGEEGEFVFDLEKELGKLKRIKEMLDRDGSVPPVESSYVPLQASAVPLSADPGPHTDPEEIKWPVPARAETEPAPEAHRPEINQFIHDYVKREQDASGEASAARTAPALAGNIHAAGSEETDFQSVFAMLERFRRSEPTDYSGEISFFQNRDQLILDGESLLRAVTTITAEARKLFGRLGQAGTPKDQFFIKQELINNQEVLRKIVLRSVRMCERESCRLPRYTEDILNPGVMKDLLERLNMDNWSNQDDFASFESTAVRLKDAFHRRITPPAKYLSSIVQELEG